MKKANTIVTLLAMAGFSFSANLFNGIGLNQDMNLSIDTSEDVYGIQFDMHYNLDHINIEELSASNSLVNGVDLYSKVKEPGFVRVIMFSMDLNKISLASQLSEVINFNVTPAAGYIETATISFDNIILAGENGQELDYPDAFVYELSGANLIPNTTGLSNVYPNPFNPSTTIDYNLSISAEVSLVIYDMKGSIVKTLVSNFQDAGLHQMTWNGKNDNGSQVSSGMYLVRMETSGQLYQQAITLLK